MQYCIVRVSQVIASVESKKYQSEEMESSYVAICYYLAKDKFGIWSEEKETIKVALKAQAKAEKETNQVFLDGMLKHAKTGAFLLIGYTEIGKDKNRWNQSCAPLAIHELPQVTSFDLNKLIESDVDVLKAQQAAIAKHLGTSKK